MLWIFEREEVHPSVTGHTIDVDGTLVQMFNDFDLARIDRPPRRSGDVSRAVIVGVHPGTPATFAERQASSSSTRGRRLPGGATRSAWTSCS
jgi:hypothetical protein